MTNSRRRATDNYRDRLRIEGLVRFEVIGRQGDQQLIRDIARRLVDDHSVQRGEEQSDFVSGLVNLLSVGATRGQIADAFRRSPLVGMEIGSRTLRQPFRKIEL